MKVANNSAAGPVSASHAIVVNITFPKGTMTQLKASGTDWETTVDATAGTIKAVYKGTAPLDPVNCHLVRRATQ